MNDLIDHTMLYQKLSALKGLAQHLGHDPVTGLGGDQVVHLEGDPPVRRMTLRGGTELQQVDRLAGVELHRVAHAVRHRDGVLGLLRELLGRSPGLRTAGEPTWPSWLRSEVHAGGRGRSRMKPWMPAGVRAVPTIV